MKAIFPIWQGVDFTVCYAPGHIGTLPNADLPRLLEGGAGAYPAAARKLIEAASRAEEAYRALATEPFAPQCLLLYLSNRCNLGCSYCYSAQSSREGAEVLPERAVRAAARMVARNCVTGGQPFQLALHGGGEPTVEWALLQRAVAITKEVAADHGVEWRAYIATNGMVEEHKARWLGQNFTEVGLSLDGPPELQNALRPLLGGQPSSPAAVRTARILLDEGTVLSVRVTVVPATVHRQPEIVDWLAALGVRKVKLEPAYLGRGEKFEARDAAGFVRHFRLAEQRAEALGVDLHYSGVRYDEIHGPYCEVLRQALRLRPDGKATACFLDVAGGPEFVIGWMDDASHEFVLDEARIDEIRRLALRIPAGCQDCINVYHCARDCPDVCYAKAGTGNPTGGFRCQVNKLYSQEVLLDIARAVDAGSYCELASEFGEPRCQPQPVWVTRGFSDSGAQAWETARERASGSQRPIAIYLHVPFCQSRCGFCDCYMVVAGKDYRRRQEGFVGALRDEIAAWSAVPGLARRVISTVHFGGGTANHLEFDLFESVAKALHGVFPLSAAAEWAVESTSSLITSRHLEQLARLGFRRLHLGVQSLDAQVRGMLGRHEHPDEVARKISLALDAGFVVSVDVLYGVPGQPVGLLLDTLRKLIGLSIDGVSLYGLNITERNERFLNYRGLVARDVREEFRQFSMAHDFLLREGYQKNHFAHFARPRDQNIYYRHSLRGEDLLALGPTADGVLAGYHYRHPKLPAYQEGTSGHAPALSGGVSESAVERETAQCRAELMCGGIRHESLQAAGQALRLEEWQNRGLVERRPRDGKYSLTAAGSWFVGALIDALVQDAGSVAVAR